MWVVWSFAPLIQMVYDDCGNVEMAIFTVYAFAMGFGIGRL